MLNIEDEIKELERERDRLELIRDEIEIVIEQLRAKQLQVDYEEHIDG